MTDKKKVWIDPNDCGLVTLEEAERKRKEEIEQQRRQEAESKRTEDMERKRKEETERKRREQQVKDEAVKRKAEEERAKTQALAKQPKPEILPPAPKVPALPPLDANSLALPDLSDLECQIRHAADMMDLRKPEGWLDSWFDRKDHRIEMKTERGRRLAGYIAACTAILEAARAHQATRQQIYLDQLTFLRRVAEENYNLELARRRVERENDIEDAKARAVIAHHEADAREASLRGIPLPPPLPPLPPPPLVDEAARKREEARRQKKEMLDLDLQELDLQADAGQEKVARAKAKATEIFKNVNLRAGEIRARIQEVLDAYQLDCSILPIAIQDFMEEGLDEEGSYQ